MFSPTAGWVRTLTSETPWSVKSRDTTASEPVGIGAPEAIRMAERGTRAAGSTSPAFTSAVTLRLIGSSGRAP